MTRRRLGYAAWLVLAAVLYFFENGTWTRILLICSLLCPLLPPLRRAFFPPDAPETAAKAPRPLPVRSFARREAEEPGDVRPYRPGDPLRRIHWKLSAKRDSLLVRESASAPEAVEEERPLPSPAPKKRSPRQTALVLLALLLLLCVALLFALPPARLGAMALANRLFRASERLNAYAYDYFPVPDTQSVAPAAVLLGLAAAALTALSLNRLTALGIMAGCSLLQAYFGLPLPAWAGLLLYGLLALAMLRRPVDRRSLAALAALVLAVSLGTLLLIPGTDPATEAASEAVRDRLSRMAQQITGAVAEQPEGETGARHTHTQSLLTGDAAARTERTYRLVTREEEQISLPRWINWLKVALLFLLLIALMVLPFAPFVLLGARRRRAQQAREAFTAGDVGEAVRACFRQVVLWLEETGSGAGNRLYTDWPEHLPAALPQGYALRFAQCARDFEEAAYSSHALPEDRRERALALLRETETALWKTADWRQRLRIKYWMCLRE